jgi:transposase
LRAPLNCGQPYTIARQRVAEYDKANPGRSTRQAADDLGVSQSEVQRARKSGEPDGSPETVKEYPARRAADRETKDPAPEEMAVKKFMFAAESIIETLTVATGDDFR